MTDDERNYSKGTLDFKSERATLKIEMLDISTLLYNTLARNRIKTVGDILLKTPKEIRGYRNLGKKSYDELIGKLEQVLEKEVFEEWAKGI